MKGREPDHVSAVEAGVVVVVRGRRRRRLPYADDVELAAVLTALRDEGLPFVDAGPGWPPGAIFADLRDRGLVRGSYDGIVWSGPGETLVRPDR